MKTILQNPLDEFYFQLDVNIKNLTEQCHTNIQCSFGIDIKAMHTSMLDTGNLHKSFRGKRDVGMADWEGNETTYQTPQFQN